MTKYSGLLNAFHAVDGDRSGRITRRDFDRMLLTLNLHNLRAQVIDYLFDLMAQDGSGGIEYKEFARVLNAPNIFSLAHFDANPSPGRTGLTQEAVKADQYRQKAAALGLTVQEYLEYHGLKESPR